MRPFLYVPVYLFGVALALCGAPSRAASDESLAQRANNLLQHRCMVCHGCFDAPCQLKLTSQEGLNRGANKEKVYDGERLIAANLTRLFDDGFTTNQWRDKGFFPVIDSTKPESSVLYQMLDLKQAHPLPTQGPMPESFDFRLDREQQCPKPGEEMADFREDYPLWGMPYGLPGLNSDDHKTLTQWLTTGATLLSQKPLAQVVADQVANWERFLNGTSNRERLMSRYLFEHLFLASLYFPDEAGTWFRMVRSRTPPGEPVSVIATRRPFDSPGKDAFYYRLQRMPDTVLIKRQMPYVLGQARMDWYRDLFLKPDYNIESLPDYSEPEGANPFHVFADMPVRSRYRFLLHEARFSIMNFIKGPVCRGQVALNVIEDRFWVMFLDPDEIDPAREQQFLRAHADELGLPLPERGSAIDLLAWRKYSKSQQRYASARSDYLGREYTEFGRRLDLDSIWDGNGNNPNGALTIFRHFDTATVVDGFVGTVPKTAWVIDYPLLERIHYLLVAGFDVYGSVAHQLESRLYMDFLRVEGESNFLAYMPIDHRAPMRDYWYRGAGEDTLKHIRARSAFNRRAPDIDYRSDQPKHEFLRAQRSRIFAAGSAGAGLESELPASWLESLHELRGRASSSYSFMPQVSFVNIFGQHGDHVVTLLRDSGYSNIAQLFWEQERRLPEEDQMTVVAGFLGAYPNSFFQVSEQDLDKFVAQVNALETTADYEALLANYGVMRNSSWFWRVSDKFHRMQQQRAGVEAGLFDYNRYQHRLPSAVD